MTIRHKDGDIVRCLAAGVWTHDAGVLANSLVFGQQTLVWPTINLAAQTPTYRLLFWRDAGGELQAVVESTGGDLRSACQTVWSETWRLARELKPRLDTLEVSDETTNDVIATASTGFWRNVLRQDIVVAVITGFVTLGAVIAGVTRYAKEDAAALVLGAAPSFAVALLLLGIGIARGARRKLVWRV